MSRDTIYREDVINALADMHCKSDEDGYVWIIRSDAWARIDALPSAQSGRKTGRWIETAEDWRHQIVWWRCSECGMDVSTQYNYCPNCGADLRTKETDYDYERAIEQLEHDILYESTFNQDDGSM